MDAAGVCAQVLQGEETAAVADIDSEYLKAPFSWPGSKKKIAREVWHRFGFSINNYVEPFFGSGAVLLGRPCIGKIETVNDKDGFIVNFFRAIQRDPTEVAEWADNPAFEPDLHARHYWLVERKKELRQLLEGDPDFYDTQVAGWWIWGMSQWIGSDFCHGIGGWFARDGKLIYMDETTGIQTKGICKKLISLGQAGKGTKSNLAKKEGGIRKWFEILGTRLSDVRIACGDWKRVVSAAATHNNGLTAVFLDPPYSADSGRYKLDLYAVDDTKVAHEVREYCIVNGDNPKLRIALCGYTGEHDVLEALGWHRYGWSTNGGFANMSKKRTTNDNRHREVVWFSPHCLNPVGLVLADDV